jgi:hypothetical protein
LLFREENVLCESDARITALAAVGSPAISCDFSFSGSPGTKYMS